jgi:hypothetical protein
MNAVLSVPGVISNADRELVLFARKKWAPWITRMFRHYEGSLLSGAELCPGDALLLAQDTSG